MAFPPNYNQERNNRAKAKQQKALDKQNKRDDKNAQRKHETHVEAQLSTTPSPKKED